MSVKVGQVWTEANEATRTYLVRSVPKSMRKPIDCYTGFNGRVWRFNTSIPVSRFTDGSLLMTVEKWVRP